MGFSDDIMHTIVEKELKRRYPASEGWVLQPGPATVGRDEVYSITRRTGGKSEAVFVGISFEKTVSDELIRELTNSLSSRLAVRSVSHLALIVPGNTDAKNVPPAVNVHRMRAFRYINDDLMWLKHPAHRA